MVESALYDAYGSPGLHVYGQTISTVIMELLPQYQRDIASLRQLYVPSSNGTLVALSGAR